MLKERRLKLRSGITYAIKYRSKLDDPLNYKITLLREDIKNRPYHVFGSHDKCANYFCDGPKPGERNIISEMENCGLWQDILFWEQEI
ncbi:unnamed protein product [Macrosiphum euphorbiae]|uniref:Uncharacterized protein n=1 Tax=Macrosiphum euphorbiae TaxID=13131 RepID=A0AAV0XWW9_9HEMI|nr:unnamed protein product [Macrosiphum euphorbiae]